MNRFRRRKDARDAHDGSSRLSMESEASIMITTKKAFRLGKKTIEPEPKSTIDLATALPSSDNFRTSLLMNGLSARFSMLREQDDPNSKFGKASDDSVMYSKRLSRYNDLEYQSQGLSDIAEISSIHSSLRAPYDIERAASNASLPCYNSNKDSQSYRSVMNRSRPGEGNNLFGGRLKINVGNRVLYDDDVRLSAYQRQRRAEKDRSRPQNGAEAQCNRITPYPLENSNFNSNNINERSLSSTQSEKSDTNPTTITYSEETSDKQITSPSNGNGSPEGRTSKIRKLYEAGLDNHLHEQQFSAMSKIDTLTRRTAITGSPSPVPSPLCTLSNHNIWNNQQAKTSSCNSFQNSISTTVPSYYNSAQGGFLSPPLTPFENDELSSDSQYSNHIHKAPVSEIQNFYQSQDKTLTTQRYRKSQDDQNSQKSTNSSSKSHFDATKNCNRTISNSTHGSKKSDSNPYNFGSHSSSKSYNNLLNNANHSSSSSKDSSQISKKAYSYQDSNHFSRNSNSDTVNELGLHQLNLSEVQPIKSVNHDQLSLPKYFYDPLMSFSSETDFLSKSSSSSILEKAPVASTSLHESPVEIIGMVRQHIRYESNTSSIYDSPPSTDQTNLASHTRSVYSKNDYLAQANPWKGDYDNEKSVVPIKETDIRSTDNKDISNLWRGHNEDEKIVVISEETHVKSENFKDTANPWKSCNNEEKIVVPSEEIHVNFKNNKDMPNLWKSYDDEKIVVSSNETNVKTKIKKSTYLSPSVRYHIGHFFNSEAKPGEIRENIKPAHEDDIFNDENLYLSPAKYDNGSSYDPIERSGYFLDEKETGSPHCRHDSTDTQREQQDLKNELASRRQHVQEKMKSFVESDNNLLSPISIPEIPRDGTLKNGVFGILRTKSSWASVKPPKRYLAWGRHTRTVFKQKPTDLIYLSKMTTPIFPDNVEASPKNISRSAARKNVVPAVPLSYLQVRQKMQAKRAMALMKAESTAQPTNKDDKSQEDLEKCDLPPQANALSEKTIVMDSLINFDEPALLSACASGLGKVQNIAQSSYSTESFGNHSKEKPAFPLGERFFKEDTPCGKQGPSQTNDSSHKLVPGTQLQNDNMHIEDEKFSQQQSLKKLNAPITEKIIVSENSESSKSSPAPPQSTAYPTPSSNHEQLLPGRYLTHRSYSGFFRHFSHICSPIEQPPLYGYYSSLNGLGNPAPVDKFARGEVIPVTSWQDICPTVKQLGPRHLCDPTTPHSFHGSQSPSRERDIGKNLETQISPVVSNNNFNGNLDYIQNYQTNPIMNNRDNHLPPLPILQNNVPQIDMFDGLIEYLSSQFANPTFADYTLELRYTDDRAAPVRIPGHNLMFARSITLRQMMLAARNETDGISSKTLLIESDDRFICTDGLYMAIHRLYGNALLNLGAIIPIEPTGQHELPLISKSTERFYLALGYAAAGHLLKMNVVVDRGCEIASQALNWMNLERGLDFALDGGLDPQWKTHSWDSESLRATYGSSVNIIIIKAIEFICHNLPAQFKLDTSVGEARFDSRLPKIPGQRHTCLNSHLSHIRFGDHAVESFNILETHQIPTVVLSRTFISLPWELLRYIFESSNLANTIESLTIRHQILSSVVREREKRRLRIYNSSIPNFERQKNSQKWLVVGWKEEVEALRGDEMYPKLIRSWVEFRTPES